MAMGMSARSVSWMCTADHDPPVTVYKLVGYTYLDVHEIGCISTNYCLLTCQKI